MGPKRDKGGGMFTARFTGNDDSVALQGIDSVFGNSTNRRIYVSVKNCLLFPVVVLSITFDISHQKETGFFLGEIIFSMK